jgi:cytidyltransferase-like protein
MVMTDVTKNAAEKIHTLKTYKKAPHKNSVLIGGCFDILHYGHITFLTAAKALGGELVIALESDEFVKRAKRRDPYHTQNQRAEMLAHIDIVDAIILLPPMNGYEDYVSLVEYVSPSVIAITEGDARKHEKEEQAKKVGARLEVVCQKVPSLSTSDILKYASLSRD